MASFVIRGAGLTRKDTRELRNRVRGRGRRLRQCAGMSPERDTRLAELGRGLSPFVGQKWPHLRALDVDEELLRNKLGRRHLDDLTHLNDRPSKLVTNRDRAPTDSTR